MGENQSQKHHVSLEDGLSCFLKDVLGVFSVFLANKQWHLHTASIN